MAAIVFDLDGTLVRFSQSYREILESAFRSVAGEVRPEWLERYNNAFFEAFEACQPEPYHQAVSACAIEADTDQFVTALCEAEVAASQPPANAQKTLERLAGEYDLGVLTNGVLDWQRQKLRAVGLDEYFDTVVASYEAGAHKPEPAPFRLVEDRLPAEHYTMVGDDDADIDGASAAGWSAIRYAGGDFEAVLEQLEG